jgi:hypothetical protein
MLENIFNIVITLVAFWLAINLFVRMFSEPNLISIKSYGSPTIPHQA